VLKKIDTINSLVSDNLRDTEFIKLMKAAPYLTVEYVLANTKNKMALVSFIGEFILNSYCVKQPLFDGYILFLDFAAIN
jgi:hypothetical protein